MTARSQQMHEPSQQILEEVNQFYEAHPFPGFDLRKYSYRDDLRRKASWFGKLLDDQIPYNVHIIDVGCGTGQLANYLALKDRHVFGVDYSQLSLDKAKKLKERLRIRTAAFEKMNVLELNVPGESFDYALCLGVLHHTSDPYHGFQNLARITRPGGYLMIGLYNPIGRFPVKLRRAIKGIFRRSQIQEEAIRRQLVVDDSDVEKTESWLADQYHHPHESTHTVGEVLTWFAANGVDYVNSIPPIEWFRSTRDSPRIFERTTISAWRWSRLPRSLVQLKWLVSLRDNGGYYIIVGQKRCTS